MRNDRFLLSLCGVLFCAAQAQADEQVIFRGRVTMEDGSSPGRLVTIQRDCAGMDRPIREGLASARTGEYVVRLQVNGLGQVLATSLDMYSQLPCVLEAYETGYVSSRIDLTDRTVTINTLLPDIVLTAATRTAGNEPMVHVPQAASRNWDLASKRLAASNWAAAEAPLKGVTESAPKFAAGWATLGGCTSTWGGRTRRALARTRHRAGPEAALAIPVAFERADRSERLAGSRRHR